MARAGLACATESFNPQASFVLDKKATVVLDHLAVSQTCELLSVGKVASRRETWGMAASYSRPVRRRSMKCQSPPGKLPRARLVTFVRPVITSGLPPDSYPAWYEDLGTTPHPETLVTTMLPVDALRPRQQNVSVTYRVSGGLGCKRSY